MRVLTDPLGWFTLQLPDGWESATENSVTTIRHPDGVGNVYLTGARHAGGRQPDFGGADFLARFLRSLGLEVEDAAITLSQGLGCRIYSYTRDGDGMHWRHFSVTDDETALLISYVCQLQDAWTEDAAVDGIVRSVRQYHSAPA